MENLDNFKATGELTLTLRDQYGQVKQQIHVPNLVVTVGKNFIASRMVGTASAIMSNMAIGTSSTAPAAANTILGAENGRVALASSTATDNTVSYSATFPAGTGTGAVVEAGIFNSGTANTGTLLCRTTFSVINKAAADSLTVNWNVTIN
jgi:hypothetical protein